MEREKIIERLHDLKRDISQGGQTTFYTGMGMMFIDDFLAEIEQ